ncbi:MAG: TolC family protein, partial [Bacteroidia bacterium]
MKNQKMKTKMKLNYCIVALLSIFLLTKCAIPKINQKKDKIKYSSTYFNNPDTANSGLSTWKLFFNDNKLKALIDTALNNNQELNIALMEIEISKAEIKARKGEYLPSVNLGANAGAEKVGRYTSQGANDANTDIKPGTKFPDPLSDFKLGLNASWEIDIWKKLRNAKKSAVLRYLATSEGKHFILTNLIAEIAKSYYELIALDNELVVLNNNIKIQTEALEIVKLEKNAAKVTELAVKKFQAEVLKNQSNLYYVKQKIIETENRINFLVGRFPQKVNRESSTYYSLNIDSVYIGVPSQLLFNRPDIKKAELELEASKLDVKSARANFYPSLSITSGLGLQAFNPSYLLKTPESLLYSITGDIMAPLINR